MKKITNLKFLVLCLMLCLTIFAGCNLTINPNISDGSSDMTPRLISLSGEMRTSDVVENVKSAIVGIKSLVSGGYAVGSGVAIREGGYILTNSHVVSNTRGITVYFADKTTAGASLIWQDSSIDLAVIKSNKDMPYLETETEQVLVGQDVIAIGTPLSLAFGHSVTKGIISALDRTLEVPNQDGSVSYMQNLIQHDASINPGNSGGPLINLSGKVVGINTLKATDAEGIGFAIPIETGESIVSRLSVDNGYSAPYMGVLGVSADYARSKDISCTENGLYIVGVDNKSIAHLTGILKGDIIYKINDTEIDDFLDLRKFIYSSNIGDKIKVYLYRSGTPLELDMILGERI
ncbi:MAG: serine protease [Clostridia bacterium]|nr:serine protease [Clostridia bacterium]